jgi:hypothetical protein
MVWVYAIAICPVFSFCILYTRLNMTEIETAVNTLKSSLIEKDKLKAMKPVNPVSMYINNTMLMCPNGKCVWKRIGDAKSAFLLHFSERIKESLFKRNDSSYLSYYTRLSDNQQIGYTEMKKHVKRVIEQIFTEVIEFREVS